MQYKCRIFPHKDINFHLLVWHKRMEKSINAKQTHMKGVDSRMKSNITFSVILKCPWCNKGKTMADQGVDVTLSCQCGVCGQFYRANLQSRRVEKTKAAPTTLK